MFLPRWLSFFTNITVRGCLPKRERERERGRRSNTRGSHYGYCQRHKWVSQDATKMILHGALKDKEMKTHICPIVQRFWIVSFKNCLYYFDISSTQQLNTWANTLQAFISCHKRAPWILQSSQTELLWTKSTPLSFIFVFLSRSRLNYIYIDWLNLYPPPSFCVY